MRTVDEIKAELNALEASPSYYGNEWKKPRRERLKGELFDAITHGIPLDRLREMCDAEREQRCVVLPCKVGTPVWSTMFRKIILDDNGKFIREEPTGNWPFDTDMISDWGECWFMTREEAEAALEKGE